ncbi:MAG: hypothetical protein KDJ17_08145 [Hyphomicrobiaceae bacterium]|nr:hypothetical protein [Hyphomicrobiaceae bacterium]
MVKVIPLLLLLAACQATGGSFCDIADPIRLSAERIDTLSDAEVARILAHNTKGQRLCGWKQ